MNKEQPIKGKEEIIQAQLELVQGYYNKIYIDNLSQETILNMLEKDREFLQQEQNVIDANNLSSKSETPIQSGEERLFTLKEALEIWDAGSNWYEDNEDFLKGGVTEAIDQQQYFKEKFNIDLK